MSLLEKLLDPLFGISEATFLRTCVVPANPNDIYYNDQCAFCLDSYEDEDHQAVRLPCNHIFGHACIIKVIKHTNGNTCPLCQTVWLRAPYSITALGQWVYRKVFDLLSIFFIHSGNFYYMANPIIERTHLRTRNPGLDVTAASNYLACLRVVYILFVLYGRARRTASEPPNAFDSVCRVGMSLSFLFVATILNRHGTIPARRDRLLLFGILLFSVAVTHVTDIWTLSCDVMGIDPMWIARAAYERHPVLGYTLVALFHWRAC